MYNKCFLCVLLSEYGVLNRKKFIYATLSPDTAHKCCLASFSNDHFSNDCSPIENQVSKVDILFNVFHP